jgi:thiamine pyrophosphate-dependent acetolactate synthase large subunit-like protein
LTPIAASVAVASLLDAQQASAAPTEVVPTIPKAFEDSMNAAARRADFTAKNGISGAQVFANLCKDEELAAMFCAPGNYSIINEIAQVGIPCFGGRSEGSMASAADGFSRVTGEVTACSGTEGPGFAHMVMNIAQAHFANTPLLVLASNVSVRSEDTQRGMQFMFQQPVTESIRKYGKRITAPNRIVEYGSYAFRNLKTGVPGVAHLDFPQEVAGAMFTDPSKLDHFYTKDQYRTESRGCPSAKEIQQAVDMINQAQRPVIVAGHGVFWRKAWEPLMTAAERNEFAVVGSGPMRGHFPDNHRLSASMANDALMSADLAVFVGQYLMPTPGEWTLAPGVKTIRVHPEGGDIGRNWPVDLGIVSEERVFMEALANSIPRKKRDAWVSEIATAKAKFDKQNMDYYALGLKYTNDTGTLHPAVINKEIHDFLFAGSIDPKQTMVGYGGNTMGSYAGRWLRANRVAQEVPCYYQFGSMGPDMAMMMGAAMAVKLGVGPQAAYKGAPTLVCTGDAGVGYSILELDTAVKYKIPLITVVYVNDCWGTYTASLNTPRALHMYLFQEKLRYDKMAEGLGARGEYVSTRDELRSALKGAYDTAAKESLPTLIAAQGHRAFTQGREFPPGVAFLPEPGVGAFKH